jgi:hypothetical protein
MITNRAIRDYDEALPACRHDCDNLTPSASLTHRHWIFSKSIVAGQEALSYQPHRRHEWSSVD